MSKKPKAGPTSATIAVSIDQFRPLGSVFPITATYSVLTASPNIKVKGGYIAIIGSQAATLTFQLTEPGYVFVGATFDAVAAKAQVGTVEFPNITINRTPGGNTLSILDANLGKDAGTAYNYILLVQDTSTGDIGLIDPIIRDDPGP